MINALVAGSTGAIGKQLVEKLESNDDFGQIHCLNRRDVDFQNPKTQNHVIDFDQLPNIELDINADVAFCSLGTTMKQAGSKEEFKKVDFDYVLHFAKWAKLIDVKKFVLVSAYGSDENSLFFYMKVKGQIEEALKNMDFEQLVIVQPSLLYGASRPDSRFGENLGYRVLNFLKPLLVGPLKKQRPVHVGQVAETMIHSALTVKDKLTYISPIDIQKHHK
jgi:uncharacterized protein YbjT (DUF2867 family)